MPWYTSEIFSVCMFLLPPAAALLILFFVKRSLIWLSVPVTVAVDALVWGPAVIRGGSYGAIALVFLIPQVLAVAAVSFLIARRRAGRTK